MIEYNTQQGRPKVYLAGTISHFSFSEVTDWRKYAKEELGKSGIVGASPMRWKDNLRNEDILAPEGYSKNAMSSKEGITTRDRWDVETSDIILMVLDEEVPSIGSIIEAAWAHLWRKPIIVVGTEDNVHCKHAMFNFITGYRVNTLEEGLEICKRILLY
jgi:nucleoside 2-deoxyribosyltransferase